MKIPTPAELAAANVKPLTGDELKGLLAGHTLFHINPANGLRAPIHYLPDGFRHVRLRGKVTRSAWRIERDMVCEQSVFLGREVCRSLYKDGRSNAVCDEGASTCDFGWAWAEGNPERLGAP